MSRASTGGSHWSRHWELEHERLWLSTEERAPGKGGGGRDERGRGEGEREGRERERRGEDVEGGRNEREGGVGRMREQRWDY